MVLVRRVAGLRGVQLKSPTSWVLRLPAVSYVWSKERLSATGAKSSGRGPGRRIAACREPQTLVDVFISSCLILYHDITIRYLSSKF